MRLALNTGICPIINVGTYQSRLSPDFWSDELDYEIENSDFLTVEEKNYYYDKSYYSFDNNGYKKILASYAIQGIVNFFGDIRETIQAQVCKDASIHSPQFYNFSSDELDFEIEINTDELDKILNMVETDEYFFKWAEKYKSRDGFISFMPYYKKIYLEAIKGKDIERAAAMFFSYIGEQQGLLLSNGWDSEYQEQFEEDIFSNNSFEDFITDEECLSIIDKMKNGGVCNAK